MSSLQNLQNVQHVLISFEEQVLKLVEGKQQLSPAELANIFGVARVKVMASELQNPTLIYSATASRELPKFTSAKQ